MLAEWLEDFLSEFRETMQVPPSAIAVREEEDEDIEVQVDPGHLRQVVWNLCDNAMKYGEPQAGIRVRDHARPAEPKLAARTSRWPTAAPASLRRLTDRIFEPFFTGRKGGTGLGLFIARELCQLNRAILLYEKREGGGSIFRIVFSDPQRWAA